MKRSEMMIKLRKLNKEALEKRISELRREITIKHVQVATGKEASSAKLGLLKKELARALTIYSNKTYAAVSDKVAKASKK